MIKVIVVDDHPVVREGLKRVIAENTSMTVTGEAGDGNEAMEVIRSKPCDVVILDLAIPTKNGLVVLQELRRERPRLPVLVVSAHREDQLALRCLRAGAAGYLKKETAVAEVVRAIRTVCRGGRYVSESLSEKLAFNPGYGDDPLHKILSRREYQVLCMMASGKTATVIAQELALSVRTLDVHRAHIREKLNLKNNTEVVRYAIKEGLVASGLEPPASPRRPAW